MKTNSILLTVAIAIILAFIFRSPNRPTASIHKKVFPPLPKKITLTAPFVYQNPNPEVAQLLTEYEAFLHGAMENNLAPGIAVAIVQDTSIVYLKGFGVRDERTKDTV